ncbi:MAG: hypothetical protein H6828_15990 [Planctomycetes bacterium]|nr:hypothetical protein [Planctomycetota bacterium]MCB9916627.1 hypothetical protein [Planctomycetota bacterium]
MDLADGAGSTSDRHPNIAIASLLVIALLAPPGQSTGFVREPLDSAVEAVVESLPWRDVREVLVTNCLCDMAALPGTGARIESADGIELGEQRAVAIGGTLTGNQRFVAIRKQDGEWRLWNCEGDQPRLGLPEAILSDGSALFMPRDASFRVAPDGIRALLFWGSDRDRRSVLREFEDTLSSSGRLSSHRAVAILARSRSGVLMVDHDRGAKDGRSDRLVKIVGPQVEVLLELPVQAPGFPAGTTVTAVKAASLSPSGRYAAFTGSLGGPGLAVETALFRLDGKTLELGMRPLVIQTQGRGRRPSSTALDLLAPAVDDDGTLYVNTSAAVQRGEPGNMRPFEPALEDADGREVVLARWVAVGGARMTFEDSRGVFWTAEGGAPVKLLKQQPDDVFGSLVPSDSDRSLFLGRFRSSGLEGAWLLEEGTAELVVRVGDSIATAFGPRDVLGIDTPKEAQGWLISRSGQWVSRTSIALRVTLSAVEGKVDAGRAILLIDR